MVMDETLDQKILHKGYELYLPPRGIIWTKLDDPNTQNLELFAKKPYTMLTISDISLAPFWKSFLDVKQWC